MAGNKIGGAKMKKTTMEKYGADFWTRIGALGGRASGGFASKKIGSDGLTGQQRAAKVGKIGGLKSRRTRSI